MAAILGRRGLEQAQVDDAGQHEFLNWVVDFVESYVFNSSKCCAVFER